MLLKNISALLGEELDFVSNVDIEIKNNKFKKIQPKIKSTLEKDVVDCQGLLLIPGFINAHTHIADSIGKDITINSTVNQKIHPIFGIKSKILKNTSEENLSTFMKNTCHSMIRKGITTFVDFREGGLDGALLLRKISSDISIRSIILGRLDFHQNSSEIKKNTPFPKEKIQDLPSSMVFLTVATACCVAVFLGKLSAMLSTTRRPLSRAVCFHAVANWPPANRA